MTNVIRPQVQYEISKKPKALMITAKVRLPTLNIIILSIVIPGYILFILWIIYFAATETVPAWFYLFIFCIIAFSFLYSKAIFSMSRRKNYWQLIVDNDRNFIECPNENFRTKISNVKNISLSDIHTIFTGLFTGTELGLKFSTDAGEKILDFPIDSYERGEELIRTIKSYL